MSPDSHDYVVIGAGAAGCALANRLSEDPQRTVLLLEAGARDISPLIHIPAGFAKLMGTSANWIFDTTPQKHLDGRSMFLPQGRVLGGSTSVNAMLYIRGNRLDYDEWRDLGNTGWAYADVLPYFRKSERNERIADRYHGTDGPLNVADQVQTNPLSKAFVRAAQQAGIPYNPDPNGAVQEGVFFHQVTQRNARRESAATAYLRPARTRSNLTILTGARATKILTRGDRATGVQYTYRGATHAAYASAELVVSSGAINSPRLLLLSGIGPADDLAALGIDVVHDLPGVGKNLHDQLEVYVTARCKDPISYSGEDRWYRAGRHALQYGLYRTGPATATITEAGAFIHSSDVVRSPDIQLHMLPAYVVWKDNARAASKIPGHGITILACNVRPTSRGEVTLVSSDPEVAPAVDPNYLAEDEDWDVAVEGFRRIRDVMAQPAFRPYLAGEHMPGDEVRNDSDVRAYIRRWSKTDYHPVGTCKMGVDDQAVVDPQLRVHGLTGLRVVDSSIMPTIISGNTQAPSIMIGELGSDLIKADHSGR